MSQYASGREIGLRLCRALGIDPRGVTGITLDADADGHALVTVTRYLAQDEADAAIEALSGCWAETTRDFDDMEFYRLVDSTDEG